MENKPLYIVKHPCISLFIIYKFAPLPQNCNKNRGSFGGGGQIPVPSLILIGIPFPSLTLGQIPAAKYEIPFPFF